MVGDSGVAVPTMENGHEAMPAAVAVPVELQFTTVPLKLPLNVPFRRMPLQVAEKVPPALDAV